MLAAKRTETTKTDLPVRAVSGFLLVMVFMFVFLALSAARPFLQPGHLCAMYSVNVRDTILYR